MYMYLLSHICTKLSTSGLLKKNQLVKCSNRTQRLLDGLKCFKQHIFKENKRKYFVVC